MFNGLHPLLIRKNRPYLYIDYSRIDALIVKNSIIFVIYYRWRILPSISYASNFALLHKKKNSAFSSFIEWHQCTVHSEGNGNKKLHFFFSADALNWHRSS